MFFLHYKFLSKLTDGKGGILWSAWVTLSLTTPLLLGKKIRIYAFGKSDM